MALEWISTGVDEYGNETGYNLDNSTGTVWDEYGNMLDQSTAQPITDDSYYRSPEFLQLMGFDEDYYEEPGFLGTVKNFLTSAGGALKGAFIDPKTGQPNARNLAGLAGGLYGLSQSNQAPERTGFQGSIPKYEAVREAVPGAYDTARRPGSSGQRYFSDTRYAAPEGVAAAREAAQQEAQALAEANRENPTRETANYAAGGLAALAKGGAPRYLNGASDGMADKIPARIDGGQEARLSHGEFVIPADVVGHLGNGNSEAGAQRLYDMMDRIRKARTGTTKQGKQINPNKFLPS